MTAEEAGKIIAEYMEWEISGDGEEARQALKEIRGEK